MIEPTNTVDDDSVYNPELEKLRFEVYGTVFYLTLLYVAFRHYKNSERSRRTRYIGWIKHGLRGLDYCNEYVNH